MQLTVRGSSLGFARLQSGIVAEVTSEGVEFHCLSVEDSLHTTTASTPPLLSVPTRLFVLVSSVSSRCDRVLRLMLYTIPSSYVVTGYLIGLNPDIVQTIDQNYTYILLNCFLSSLTETDFNLMGALRLCNHALLHKYYAGSISCMIKLHFCDCVKNC